MSDSLLLDTLRERRTVRRYTDQEVTMEEVKALLAAAMSAPSMLNRRPWHFVVVRAPETRELVVDSLRLHPGLGSAPVFVAVLADGGKSPTWRLDLSGAIQNLLLAATGMGLGAAWINAADSAAVEGAAPALRRALHIPEHFSLLAFVAVGHPAEQLPPHEEDPMFFSTRVHYDRWNQRLISR
ncbi:MAG: nitroreductase family protein [Chloroflexi bacterium]|nr:nitroreductase family protein [Chloroflexota bacterium]